MMSKIPMKTTPGNQDEDTVKRLLSQASERQVAPAELKANVRAAVYGAWKQQTQTSAEKPSSPKSVSLPRQYRGWWMAMAASLVVGLGLTVLVLALQQGGVTPPATVAKVQGNAWYRTQGDAATDWRPLAADQALPVGSQLRTPAGGRVALAWGKISVRINEDTHVTLKGDETLALNGGQLYVDTGAAHAEGESAFTVLTPHGQVRDIGTQFQVRSADKQVAVEVREGIVDLHRQDADIRTQAGERVSVSDTGALTREALPVDSDNWNWAVSMAPNFKIESVRLTDFLLWASRELGKPLRFAGPLVELGCKQTILHGNIDNLTPKEALSTVLATTRYRLASDSSDAIVILER